MSQWGKKNLKAHSDNLKSYFLEFYVFDLKLRIYKAFDFIVMMHNWSRNQEVNSKECKTKKNLEYTVDTCLNWVNTIRCIRRCDNRK